MNQKFKSVLLNTIAFIFFTACTTQNSSSLIDFKAHFIFSTAQELFATKATKPINENNPIVNTKFTADPAVLVYNDTIYVYGTNDSQEFESTLGNTSNSYEKINTLNVYSSKDMVNWTDEGEIPVAKKNNNEGAAGWATNSWAPAICTKKINGKDKFFLYFADNAGGIGVLTSDSPTGPFIDPIGKALVSRSTPNTQGVHWLFDPAVLVDDDGKGYLYYGGGTAADVEHPKSARCVALGDDMISLAGTPVEIDPPFLFEDSGINKINGKYYYSFCTNWADRKNFPGSDPAAVIAYMVSDNPLGPFTYKGYFLKNPGNYFGAYGNNHHWVFEMKGKYYVAFHAETSLKQLGLAKGGYRSIYINELKINADGTIPVQESSNINKKGVAPLTAFNPYEVVSGSTLHSSSNLVVTKNKTTVPAKNGAYLCIKNVNFNKACSKIAVKAGANSGEGEIKVMLDNPTTGTHIATIPVKAPGEIKAAVTLPSNISDSKNLYFVFTGLAELESWQFK